MGASRIRLISALTLSLTASAAQAQLLRQRDLPDPKFPVVLESGIFLEPNEFRPQDAIPLLRESTAGAYVTVGTERGFVSAAISNATHLISVDMDVSVIRFNRLNTALLAAAPNREAYVHLRLTSSFEEWKKASTNLASNDPMRELLTNQSLWHWWNERVRHVNGSNLKNEFGDFHAQPKPGGKYDGANYLWDDKLFNKLHKMALRHKIESHLIDLRANPRLEELVKAINQGTDAPTQLSVLDISNAWNPRDFLSPAQLADMLRVFSHAANPRSLLLATRLYNGSKGPEWSYVTKRFSEFDPSKANVDDWFNFSSPAAFIKYCGRGLLNRVLKAAQKTTLKLPAPDQK